MFRFLTTLALALLVFTSLVSSTPVPVPGHLSIPESSSQQRRTAKRSSALSASARAMSNLGNRAAAKKEKRVESTSEWIKREIDIIEATVGNMERGLVELVKEHMNLSGLKKTKRSKKGKNVNKRTTQKFAGRSKDASEEQEATLRRLSKSRRSTTANTTTDTSSARMAKRSTVPAAGLTAAALGECYYVGSDFLMHDCNALLDKQKASLNSAKTPKEQAIFSSASAALAAKATPAA